MTRGVLFTLDAAFALAVAVGALAAIVILSQPPLLEPGALRLSQTAHDTLNVLQLNRTAHDTLNASDASATQALESFLNATLPSDIRGRIRMDVYEYRTGSCGSCTLDGNTPVDGFCRCRQVVTSREPSNVTAVASGMVFAYNNSVPTFSNVTLEVWAA